MTAVLVRYVFVVKKYGTLLNEMSLIFIYFISGISTDKVRLEHDHESRRASSRGLIPKAKVKTVKMTFVIVFGNY